jgi:RNA polymerase sigma factor (sigma-70 family)
MQTAPSPGLEDALRAISSSDEETARVAWENLWRSSRAMLHAYLRSYLCNQDDREDVIQECFLKVWHSRFRFREQGTSSWFAFLKKIAYRCMIDLRRRYVRNTLSLDDVPEAEVPAVMDIADTVASAVLAGELYLAADVLWLGLDMDGDVRAHQQQLLAAQLHHLHHKSWQEILRLLGYSGMHIDRHTLDRWLSHPGVLRHLIYRQIYYSNERLAAYLLGLPAHSWRERLDEVAKQVQYPLEHRSLPPAASSWDEVWLVLWRYRYAVTPSQILQRDECPYTEASLERALDSLDSRLPFRQEMERLKDALDAAPGACYDEAVHQPGLWQRLALQYCYHDGLTHNDIYQRVAQAAECAGYRLTMGMLNVWLSNGRLVQRLAKFYRDWKGKEEAEDAF